MSRPCPSLSANLVVRLIAAQVVIYLAAMAVWMMFSPYAGYDDLAGDSARQIVRESVRTDAAGALVIAPTPALRSYAARRPGFVYAAVSGGKVLPGSSPVLANAIARMSPLLPRNGRLDLRAPGIGGKLRFAEVRGRDLVIVTAGNSFRLEDAHVFFSFYAPAVLPMAIPALLGAIIVIPFAVRRALRPLRTAGEAAGAIDLRSLDRRLPADGLPIEFAPFVSTINALLDRLDDGFRRQRRFTANAAHELRTPVAILRARVDGMADGPVKLALIADCKRLAVLVDQLLDVARLEQREVPVNETVDMIDLLRDLVADCAPMAIRSSRSIAFVSDLDAAAVRGNRPALRSALANLIDNALRVEPEDGVVEVRLGGGAGGAPLAISIVDHGPGILPADTAAVFEPFWRKDEHKPGTGLGLSIAREIANLHGGRLRHRPTPRGGATFIFELPPLRAAVLQTIPA